MRTASSCLPVLSDGDRDERMATGSGATHAEERPRTASLAARALAPLRLWRRRWLQRRELALMDERMLRDIGLQRADVRAEMRKWFWMP